MNILISGASGLVGRALCESFSQGHHLFLLKRARGGLPPWWDIGTKRIALGQEERIDVVIHLAGENIAAGRWGRLKKKKILESRIQGTRTADPLTPAWIHGAPDVRGDGRRTPLIEYQGRSC